MMMEPDRQTMLSLEDGVMTILTAVVDALMKIMIFHLDLLRRFNSTRLHKDPVRIRSDSLSDSLTWVTVFSFFV
jgi:hypothetical protein